MPRPLLCPPWAGYDDDLETAAALPELDLIVGGHTHTFLADANEVPLTSIADKNVNLTNCAAAGACDVPQGPYPTFVAPSPGAAKRVGRASGPGGVWQAPEA